MVWNFLTGRCGAFDLETEGDDIRNNKAGLAERCPPWCLGEFVWEGIQGELMWGFGCRVRGFYVEER